MPKAANSSSDGPGTGPDTAEPSGGPGGSKPAGGPLPGGLYLVATPIGNIRDISLRALDVLAAADRVACEDTRMTGKLLSLLGIGAELAPYHDHNAARALPGLVRRMEAGAAVALVSDAGTPLVSDPGYRLVRACIEAGIPVTAVPGPSAGITGLILSGLPTDKFLFAGFPPPKPAARRKEFQSLRAAPATLIFQESARRLAASLADMAAALGDREAAVARELTKLHEEVRRGPLRELADHYRTQGPPKGEVVVVVGPPAGETFSDEAVDRMLLDHLQTLRVRDAAAEVAELTGLPRKRLYARALELKD